MRGEFIICYGILTFLFEMISFSVRSPKELFMFPASSKPGARVKSLVFTSEEKKVYIVLDNGG